jgi:hypothetical protein
MQLPAAAGTMTHPPAVAKKTQPPAIKNGNAESIIIAKQNNELAKPAPKGASAHKVPSSNNHSAIEKQNELINNKQIDIRQLECMMAATITKTNANSKKTPLWTPRNFENVFSVKQHTFTTAGSLLGTELVAGGRFSKSGAEKVSFAVSTPCSGTSSAICCRSIQFLRKRGARGERGTEKKKRRKKKRKKKKVKKAPTSSKRVIKRIM